MKSMKKIEMMKKKMKKAPEFRSEKRRVDKEMKMHSGFSKRGV